VADQELCPDGRYECMATVMPREVWRNPDLEGHDVPRALYECKASQSHADRWTDWLDFTVRERLRILAPTMGDAGMSWAGLKVAPCDPPKRRETPTQERLPI